MVHLIKQTGDIERIVAKIPLRKISPREVVQLAKGLHCIEELKLITKGSSDPLTLRMSEQLHTCESIREKLKNLGRKSSCISK